jgi:hypothetical protein
MSELNDLVKLYNEAVANAKSYPPCSEKARYWWNKRENIFKRILKINSDMHIKPNGTTEVGWKPERRYP